MIEKLETNRLLNNSQSLFFDKNINKKSKAYIKSIIPLSIEDLHLLLINCFSYCETPEINHLESLYVRYIDIFNENILNSNSIKKDYPLRYHKVFDLEKDKCIVNTRLDFYLMRGYSEVLAKEILSKRQNTIGKLDEEKFLLYQERSRNSRTLENMLLKHGKEKLDSINKCKGKSKNPEYISQKMDISLESAKQLISEQASNAGKIFWEKFNNGEYPNYYINTQIQYYLNKGLSHAEAIDSLSNRQSTFSLKKCIEKYGLVRGERIFKQRQQTWQNTLNSKSDEEKLDILIRKFSHNNKQFYSNESILFLDKIIELFKLDISKIQYKNSELTLFDNGKVFMYDFCFDEKYIIEYNGSHCHAGDHNKNNFKPVYSNITWDDQLKKDLLKIEVAKKHGYEIISVWDIETFTEKFNKVQNLLSK